ncbi:rod shape-determining protein MreC [Candidatus Azambacteria bacterium RIFCSPHIGHO2_01_FULL_40_24]|uniref:Cell shape-determining protein MreC n=1 Tax=Candidatus Azambacteria bacterium RIFCSPHIGHO2_01_FULL_40_24 TaxID=1797301 RepID=A0A1F5B1V4_9BACT|nr:MAG: rod shape-determining protein MreC [Candidatus Azambacteria bacterium RIFCSPHIGHO2_01_FULL_40_24]
MTKHKSVLFFVLFLVSVVIIFFNQSGPVLLFKNYIAVTLRPFEIIFSQMGNKFMFWQNAFFSVRILKESNVKLATENLELYGKLAKLSQIEEENKLLKEKLNLYNKNFWDTSLASIIGRDFENNRSFVIDKGVNDGIAVGMPVIFKGEVVVGKISDVNYNTSKVKTIIDVSSKIAAVSFTGNVSGLVRGLGSDIIFDLIAKNKKPEIGDLIISSGTDGLWPRGLLIGKVKQVKSEDSQVFNTADIELLADFRDFDNVFVILK